MVYPINKDPLSLARKSVAATETDLPIGQDLLDTLRAHEQECVGMAANMIGFHKRIIAVNADGTLLLMYNPEILRASGRYETEEGCLSLAGVRPAARFRSIKVRYQDSNFSVRIKTFSGWTAQIIQHEIDHCNGVLI